MGDPLCLRCNEPMEAHHFGGKCSMFTYATPQANELTALRERLINAKFALEYWERESKVWSDTRVPGARPGWMTETRRRGREEIAAISAILSHPQPSNLHKTQNAPGQQGGEDGH